MAAQAVEAERVAGGLRDAAVGSVAHHAGLQVRQVAVVLIDGKNRWLPRAEREPHDEQRHNGQNAEQDSLCATH